MSGPSQTGRPRRVIVHIGMPKTGTTTIQSWLYANVRALADQGIYVNRLPLTRARAFEHVEVGICQFDRAGALLPNKRMRYVFGIKTLEDQARVAARYTEKFAAAMGKARAETVILSAEDIGLATKTPEQAAALGDWLGQFFDEVRILVYVRRQEELLASSYSQILKTGLAPTFDQVFERRKKRNYFKMLKVWTDVLGDDALTVRLFERDAMQDGDLLTDFAAAAGFDPAPLRSVPRRNSSLTRASCEYLRGLNQALIDKGVEDPLTDPLRGGVVEFLTEAFADAEPLRLTAAQIAEVRRINAPSNERLRAKYFPHRDALFPARASIPPDQPPLTPAEVAEVGVAVLEAKHNGLLKHRGDPRAAPGLHHRLWRHTKEHYPSLAARIGPIIGREATS